MTGQTLHVNGGLLMCREHMICPLPRASEMSAFRTDGRRDRASQGGGDALRRGRCGAGHEDAGGHPACAEWHLTWLQAADILDLDLRTLRRWRARFGRQWRPRPLRPTPTALAPSGAGARGEADPD